MISIMITQEAFDIVNQKRQEQEAQSAAEKKFAEESQQRLIGKDSVILGIQALVDYLERKGDGVTVKNQLKSISTPDVEKVVEAVKVLDTTVKGRKDVDLSPVVDSLKKMEVQLSTLPRVFPEEKEQREDVKVTNLSEIDTRSIVEAINELDLKVDAPIIKTEKTDILPLQKALRDILEAITTQEPPENESPFIEAGVSSQATLRGGRLETVQTNILVDEEFDEIVLKYDKFSEMDDEREPIVEGVRYLLDGMLVAETEYKYTKKGNLVSVKKLKLVQ